MKHFIKTFIHDFLVWIKVKELKGEELHSHKLKLIAQKLSTEKQSLINILPEQFKEFFEQYSFLSGGCIYSLYRNEQPKDYDFFLKSRAKTEEIREYFMDQAGYHGNGISGGTYNKHPLLITENAISIGKYQIILRWIGEPEEVCGEFDFKHNQFYFDNGEISGLVQWKYLMGNELVYKEKRARDICGTIVRISKFLKRGMIIRNKEVSKMLLKLHEVGFNERELEILNSNLEDKHFGS